MPRLSGRWRECRYCGATVRRAYCSWSCQNSAQRLRDVERGHPTRSHFPGPLYSEWEVAEREFRLRLVQRMVRAGCEPEIAMDEAGFPSSDWSKNKGSAYRAMRRRMTGEVVP